jgi:hypothetical protein
MHLAKLIHTKIGKVVMSVILGFGLATLFRSVCKGKNCIILEAPPMDEVKDKIFRHQNKCYKFKPVVTKCNSKKEIIGVENTK